MNLGRILNHSVCILLRNTKKLTAEFKALIIQDWQGKFTFSEPNVLCDMHM